VTISNCGRAAFQKKPKAAVISATCQKPWATNMPQKTSVISKADSRTTAMRRGTRSPSQALAHGATMRVSVPTAISWPISKALMPRARRNTVQYGTMAPRMAK
jgi:hypothetical protein